MNNNLSTTKVIAANTLVQIFGKVFSLAITVLTTYIIARTYGREDYGAFSLMQNWPALFFIIIDFGLNAIATRDLTRDYKDANKYFWSILYLRTIVSFLLIFILAVGIEFLPYPRWLKTGIFMSLFLILTQAFYATANIIFQVKLRYDISTLSYIIGYTLIFLLIIFLSYKNANVVFISFSYVIGGVLTFLLNLYFLKGFGITFSKIYDPELSKYLVLQALPLGLMFVFSQVNFKSDSLLLSVMKLPESYNLNNNESVALYSLPYKVFEVGLVVPTFLMNSVFPVLVRKMSEGKQQLQQIFVKTLVFLAFSGVLAGILGVVLAPVIISILGGAEFYPSILVLKILFAGVFLYFVTQPIAWLIVALDKQRFLPAIYLVSAVFNLSANLYFIPKYTFYASAFITHVSELIVLILLIIAAGKAWRSKYA